MIPRPRQQVPASLGCLLGRSLCARSDWARFVRPGTGGCRAVVHLGTPGRDLGAPGRDGNLSVNVDPPPSLLITVTLPPCAAVTCLTIARPSPVPPVTLDLAGSTR